jgi:hypothetical protein
MTKLKEPPALRPPRLRLLTPDLRPLTPDLSPCPMSAPDLYTSAAHIRDAFDDLQKAWLEASAVWNDGVSRAFCENHLEPLGPVVKLALDSIGRMSTLTREMHRDCES